METMDNEMRWIDQGLAKAAVLLPDVQCRMYRDDGVIPGMISLRTTAFPLDFRIEMDEAVRQQEQSTEDPATIHRQEVQMNQWRGQHTED